MQKALKEFDNQEADRKRLVMAYDKWLKRNRDRISDELTGAVWMAIEK
jgi:hypothetical protein